MAIDRQPDPESLSGPQKAAIFLLAMGEEFTRSFLKRLDEESIQKIGRCMAEITYVPSNVLDAVLTEFLTSFRNEANMFVNIIKGEHPQTIALILSYLPHEKAGDILNLLPEEIKPDIALRIVQIGQVPDDIVMELDEAIKKNLSKVVGASRKFDGVEALAGILNQVDADTEGSVLSALEKEDGDLADLIRQKMFVFEDLLEVDDRSFREILKNIDNQLLIKALKTASEEMKQKIFSNLSERAAAMLKEDMEVMGPVRLKEVEDAQQAIIRAAKTLEGEGKIVLVGKGKEDVLV